MRRTIARYLIFALIQTLRMTSITVKKRFPTLAHLCEAGIITENEQKIVEGLDDKCIQVSHSPPKSKSNQTACSIRNIGFHWSGQGPW